MIFNNNYEII